MSLLKNGGRMIITEEVLKLHKQPNARGGIGVVKQFPYLDSLKIDSKLTGFNLMVLEPGVTIGYHQHVGSEELYYILEGTPTVTDDGVDSIVEMGTVIWTGNGHFHSLANRTEEVVKFLAFVVMV